MLSKIPMILPVKPTLLILGVLLATIIYFYYSKKESFSGSGREVVFFHLPGCSHCERVAPIWDKLVSEFASNTIIKLSSVNADVDEEVINKYNIQGFPTIAYIKDGKIMNKYSGNRSYEDLKRFITNAAN